MSSNANLKKLQLLKDKLELRKDDIAVYGAALQDEGRELSGKQEQIIPVSYTHLTLPTKA